MYPTAWLNGLRGLAAFLVMMAHFTMSWLSPLADAPFGAAVRDNKNPDDVWYFREGERLWAFWRLPILRVFMVNGGGQVAVFFVISGFVLSWGPLGLVEAGEYEKLYQSLGSSTIRRWFRLFLPCAIVSIAYLVHGVIKKYNGIGPMLEQIMGYFVLVEKWANPFQPVHDSQSSGIYAYNLVIWTIPYEFSGSIFVYVVLLGLGRVRSFPRRITIIVLITLYALISLRWDLWLFGSGMAMADYCRISGGFNKLSRRTHMAVSVLWSLCLALGLLLLSFMPHSDWFSRPGYEWTVNVPLPVGWRDSVGEERFFWGCGSILVVASSCHLSLVRRFFEHSFLQYLGKISFMLYLIHFLINHTIAMPIRGAIYAALCRKEYDEDFDSEVYLTTPIINVAVFIVLWLFCVPIVLIVAHTLEKFVDKPITEFSLWLDGKFVDGLGTKNQPRREEAQPLASLINGDTEMGVPKIH